MNRVGELRPTASRRAVHATPGSGVRKRGRKSRRSRLREQFEVRRAAEVFGELARGTSEAGVRGVGVGPRVEETLGDGQRGVAEGDAAVQGGVAVGVFGAGEVDIGAGVEEGEGGGGVERRRVVRGEQRGVEGGPLLAVAGVQGGAAAGQAGEEGGVAVAGGEPEGRALLGVADLDFCGGFEEPLSDFCVAGGGGEVQRGLPGVHGGGKAGPAVGVDATVQQRVDRGEVAGVGRDMQRHPLFGAVVGRPGEEGVDAAGLVVELREQRVERAGFEENGQVGR